MNEASLKVKPPGEAWVEKKGGFLLSLFLHILLFSLLITKSPIKMIKAPAPQRLFIQLSFPPPVAPREEIAPPLLPPAARATLQDVPDEASPEDPTPPEEKSIEKPPEKNPSEIYPNAIAEIQREIQEEEAEIERFLIDLRSAVEKRSVRVMGEKAAFNSDGAESGTVRTLDIGNVPREIADPVLKRYHIRIIEKYIRGENEFSYLNRAQIRDRTYLSRRGSGFYEVFELPLEAMKKLTLLEMREVRRRGLDPNSTHVSKITFGIVEQNGDYDLGVTHFEYRELD